MAVNVVIAKKNEKGAKRDAPYWRLHAFMWMFLLWTTVTLGQHHLHQFWQINIEDGLVNNIVNDITQDNTGYTWIATSGGLQKFDGMNFVTFTTTNSNLLSNHITSLYSDDANVMWVITPKGLCKYNAAANDVIPVINDVRFEHAFFFQDAEDRIWISAGGIYYTLDVFKSNWNNTQPNWAPGNTPCRFITAHGPTNNIWAASKTKLFSFDNRRKALTEIDLDEKLRFALGNDTIREITAMHVDKHNQLLVAVTTSSGKASSFALHVITKEWKEWKGTGAVPIHTFFTTVEGTTWGLGKNILRAGDDRWHAVEPAQAEFRARFQSPGLLRTIYENRDGSIWIGTNNGIFIFTPQAQQFAYYQNPLASADEKKNTVIIALTDSLLLLTRSGGSPIVTDLSFQPQPDTSVQLSFLKNVTAVHKDDKGDLWLASNKKLYRVNPRQSRREFFTLPNAGTVLQITSDRNTGDIWMATSGGSIVKFTPDVNVFSEVARFNYQSEVDTNENLIIENNGRMLWLVLRDKVICFNLALNTREVFEHRAGVINQSQDYDREKLVLASDEGLFFFDKKSGNTSPVYNGKDPFNYSVAGVSVDIQKNMWASTKGNGLFRISASGREARQFGTNEGVVYRGFTSAKNISIAPNRMAIVTAEGILAFDPLHTPGPLFNPRVQITSFIVNETEQINSMRDEMTELRWNENNVRIGFSSMSFLYNDQTSFSFMLRGYDKDWTKVMQPEVVKYTNLPPGDYTFQVRCMAATGEVMSDEATLSFSIVAPFWKSLTFKIVVSLAIALGVFLFYYIRHIRRKNIQEIKNKISRDLHDHIGSSLSSISLMLNVAETKMQSNPQQSSALLKKIENTAQLTQENLHDIVWSIQNEKNSMGDIVDRMEEFYVTLFEGQQAKIEFEIDPSIRDLNLDLQKRYNLYLLFKEIVNNGAKYSKATRVSTAIRKSGNMVFLSYDDNGVGFSTDPPPEGNGLANMKQRATMLGGTISIQSKPGHGTQIELAFPK